MVSSSGPGKTATVYRRGSGDPAEPIIGPTNLPGKVERGKPSRGKKYPLAAGWAGLAEHEGADWPGREECVAHVTRFPEWGQLPSVYLPPDNKGFNIQQIIQEDIGLGEPGSSHPLPWYPPACPALLPHKLPPQYASLPGLQLTPDTGNKEKSPDESIKKKFLDSFGEAGSMENIAELGARLKSAMEAGLWPPWLLHTLVGSYWRVVGGLSSSLACYTLALAEVPTQHRDLVLTNLGVLLYRTGQVDSALKLLQEAAAICDTEPETQFFLGNLLAAKGNMSGAVLHYRAALRLEPDYPGGLQQLRVPACYLRHHAGPEPGIGQQQQQAGQAGSCQARQEHQCPPGPPSPNNMHNSLTSIQVSDAAVVKSCHSQPAVQHCRPRAQCCKPVQLDQCGEVVRNSCNVPAKPSYEVSHLLGLAFHTFAESQYFSLSGMDWLRHF